MPWQDFLLNNSPLPGQVGLINELNKPFEFNPYDYQNDPALQLIRSNAYSEGERRKRSNLNELARSGLLGTSAGLSVLGTGDALTSHNIETGMAGLFEQRRQEELQLYREKKAFERQMQLARLQAMLQDKYNSPGFDWAGLGRLGVDVASLFMPGAEAIPGVVAGGRTTQPDPWSG